MKGMNYLSWPFNYPGDEYNANTWSQVIAVESDHAEQESGYQSDKNNDKK